MLRPPFDGKDVVWQRAWVTTCGKRSGAMCAYSTCLPSFSYFPYSSRSSFCFFHNVHLRLSTDSIEISSNIRRILHQARNTVDLVCRNMMFRRFPPLIRTLLHSPNSFALLASTTTKAIDTFEAKKVKCCRQRYSAHLGKSQSLLKTLFLAATFLSCNSSSTHTFG